MLALDSSLFNREYNLMNVWNALASIVSMCTCHSLILLDILHYLQMECSVHSIKEENQAVYSDERSRPPESCLH
jgi:hypothetical protein